MKRFFPLLLLFVLGCVDPSPRPVKFGLGQKVKIAVNEKKAIVTLVLYDGRYQIGYSDDFGELRRMTVEEFELEEWKDAEKKGE